MSAVSDKTDNAQKKGSSSIRFFYDELCDIFIVSCRERTTDG